MKTFFLSLGLFSFLVTSTKEKVYLCNSKNGKKYHLKRNCKGLNACTHEIILVELFTARKKGKTICGFEN